MQQTPLASSFRRHVFEKTFTLPASGERVFDWMLRKKTFTSGQLPPYRVEFLQENESEWMQEGDWTNHHGPLITFAGRMTKIEKDYRRLDYHYGSYALSFRLARPVCLEVATNVIDSSRSQLIIRLTTDVKNYFYIPWHLLMWLFWNSFALSAKASWSLSK
jgi:hypothetical protein